MKGQRQRENHPESGTILRFAKGEADRIERRHVVAHLLSGCPVCSTSLARRMRSGKEGAAAAGSPAATYADAVARAAEAARLRAADLDREAAASRRVVPLLSRQPRPRQLLLLHNSRQCRALALCEALLTESFALREEDPAKMLELAELAFRVAADLDKDRYGPRLVTDLRTRAAAELAHALWRTGRTGGATRLMLAALQLLRHGTGDPLLRARVYDLAASVLRHHHPLAARGRFLERALRIYQRFGEHHQAGRVLVSQGMDQVHRGEPLEGLELMIEAVGFIDPGRDPQLTWTAMHYLVWSLVDLGRYRGAADMLEEIRPAYLELGQGLERFHLAWLEGRIAAGWGDEAGAEERYVEAAQGFLDAGHALDAVLVLMDLALLLHRYGRDIEVRILFHELLASSGGLGLEREAVGALLVLRDSLRRRQGSASQIEKVAAFLRRLRHEPGLTFAGAADRAD